MKTLAQSIEDTTQAFRDFNRAYQRSVEIEKWRARSTRFSIPRWRRLVARYVHWCLVLEVRREIATKP